MARNCDFNSSCQKTPQKTTHDDNSCEVYQTERLKEHQLDGTLTLSIKYDSIVPTNFGSAVRLFVNMQEADSSTPINDLHYLTAFSTYGVRGEGTSLILNFSSYMNRFSADAATKILHERMFITFVAVPVSFNEARQRIKVINCRCVLDFEVR
jgi:hypothetical protein